MSDATEAEVEAVARALAQMARETIAALDAVREVDHFKADAWDEGFAAGFCESRHPFKTIACAPHENPYRQTTTKEN